MSGEAPPRPASPSERKRDLLAALLRERGLAPNGSAIPRRGAADAPLSFAQQRLWFLEQLEPGLPVYNITGAIRLRGPLDRAALQRSLGEIVRRHQVLRATFVEIGGEPRQQVAAGPIELPLCDLGTLPEVRRAAEMLERAKAQARRPFDLARGPYLRLELVRAAADDHALLLALHHAVADGLSLGIFVRELRALYAAFREGRPSPLPDLPVQYGDFAAWQRERLQGETLQGHLDYWRGLLRDVPTLELPTDRPRPPVQSFHGDRRSLLMSPALVDSLRALARGEGTTLFVVLLAAFQVLLHRYTRQPRLAVGSPIAGRTRSELESLIGFFANTLVLPADFSGAPSFRDIVDRARRVVLGAEAHQELPFERLVEELDPDRDVSRSPLFQVAFAFQQSQPAAGLPVCGLSFQPVGIDADVSKFDLTLYATDTPNGLLTSAEFRTDLFEGGRIERMLGHYQRVVEEVVREPGQRVSRLSYVGEEERRRVV
ncbi:MAG TPA: condensation domain-containing protein, partial [Vicinamibacteria bacterium]|nr:condensation domain-containing protein [Vicinamibacteria bacterium]